MQHVSLDAQDEAVKQFVLSLTRVPGGSVLELDGREVARLLPSAAGNGDAPDEPWTDAKNARRCALIDQKIAGTLCAEEAEELHRLQQEMLRHRRRVAPLPLDDGRSLHRAEATAADE